jgi:cytochrome P450
MNESMRLYPPVAGIGRKVAADDEAEDYHLKAERKVFINITGLHHHPAYWEKPFEFYPEHFENFELKGDNRFIFMPFGAGPRICIGNSFAMLEMQLINSMLSASVEMDLAGKEITPVPLITLKPGDGVMMRLKKVTF